MISNVVIFTSGFVLGMIVAYGAIAWDEWHERDLAYDDDIGAHKEKQ